MTDAEVEAAKATIDLAAEIAGPPPSAEDVLPETKPDGDKPPEAKVSGEDPPVEKGEKEPPEKKEGPDDDDPLKDIDVKALLKHPDLGPAIQTHVDNIAREAAEAAVDKVKGQIQEDAVNTFQEKQWANRFKSLDQHQLSELISSDTEAASAYARYQDQLQRAASMDPQEVVRAGQVYAYTAAIATHDAVLEAAGLPDDAKAKLDPKNFVDQGVDGIVAWGEAIAQAIIDFKVGPLVTAGLEEKWETHRDEKLAEEETNGGPPSIPTRKGAGVPDLMKTPSSQLLEGAFAGRETDAQPKKET